MKGVQVALRRAPGRCPKAGGWTKVTTGVQPKPFCGSETHRESETPSFVQNSPPGHGPQGSAGSCSPWRAPVLPDKRF